MVTSIGTSQLVLLSILVLSIFSTSVQAHSSAWPTITRSETILNLQHDILPRTAPYSQHRGQPLAKRNADQRLSAHPNIITRDDTVRLQFSAFNTTFHLYLEPNTDLIHPEANLGPDIFLEDIKAFKGVVIQDKEYSDHKWKRAATTSRIPKRTVEHMLHEEGVVGWARMMVEHDVNSEDEIVLRGAFMVNGDTYHVTTRHHYHVQKRSEDASPAPTSADSTLVIYRDSDLYKPAGRLRKRRESSTDDVACGADNMLNKTAAYIEATSSHSYYYPPVMTATIPMSGGFDMSSSWTDVLKAPLVKRDVAVNVAGPNPVPTGCPTNRLVNYMGVAADCAYVRSYGGQPAARKQIFADFNTASGIYESTFNVALGVISLNITSENCPATPVKGEEWNQECSTAYTIDQRLSDFSFWRGQNGRSDDGAGLWHLMTKCNSGPVVGIAWTKALCQTKSQSQNANGQGVQYTAGTGVSSITPNEWMVVAHEIGHGFGAIHDCTTATCPDTTGQCCPLSTTTCDAGAQFIMNPSEQTATRVFSPCSISAICGTIQSSSGQCLQPPGTRQTQNSEANICGNGLKETGEDCDCGSPEDCANDPCCDGTTCKFKGGAICDDINDDCCQNCQLKPAGQVCRQAISECDIQEVCSGSSPTCPPDVKVPDLTPCNNIGNATNLQCSNGVCTSRDLQCQQQDRPGINRQCGASNSCDLMCNDPTGNPLTCVQIPGTFFLDGSPCGFGGVCSAGQCAYSSGIGNALGWARNHLVIVIPVGCCIGLILICCIWGCCCSRYRHRFRKKNVFSNPSAFRPTRARSVVAPRGVAGGPVSPGPNPVQRAQHGNQQYSVPPALPSPVYYDPAAFNRLREEEELQRALEASRKEHEKLSRSMSFKAEPMNSVSPSSRTGVTTVSMPRVETLPPVSPSLRTGETTVSMPRVETSQPGAARHTSNGSNRAANWSSKRRP